MRKFYFNSKNLGRKIREGTPPPPCAYPTPLSTRPLTLRDEKAPIFLPRSAPGGDAAAVGGGGDAGDGGGRQRRRGGGEVGVREDEGGEDPGELGEDAAAGHPRPLPQAQVHGAVGEAGRRQEAAGVELGRKGGVFAAASLPAVV